MNVNNFSHSASTSKTQVTSKYFSNEAVLDESLTEFQEKRKIVGPKNPKKAPKRKCQKRIKGQKDIRTLIQKKNDLIEYSKKFNNICMKSGVDIDSEQLQLAIALSKSLHDSKQCPNDTDVTKTLTTREKCNKIRTTLQEYGFHVPEVKATNSNKIKQKRYNLLTTSDEEKQQIISAKYLQILSSNSNHVIIESNLQKESIFYKSTCMLFEEMKNDDVFYVHGLIDKSLNTIIFLRDWIDIPGRCQSPVFEGPHICFNDIICSQDELDIFLSGCIAMAQNICHVKLRNYTCQTERLHYNTSHGSVEQAMSSKILSNETLSLSMSEKINNLQHKDIEILNNDKEENYIVNETLSQPLSMVTEYIDSETDLHHKTVVFCVSKSLNETTVSPDRCESPDLFDEEVSTILNMSSELSKPIVKYDTIDLTQCVPSNIKPQISNVSKRLSNDVMELTECISRGFNSEDKIDLTQELNEDDTIAYVDDNVNYRRTMSSSEIFECDQVIILDEINPVSIVPDSVADVIKENIQIIDTMNLTESSDTCDSFPDIKVRGGDKKGTIENINETLYEKLVTEVPNFTSRDNDSNIKTDKLNRNNISFFVKDNSTNENIDLTQSKEYNYCSLSSDLSKIYNLGKIDNLSDNCDDMFDQIIKNSTNASKSTNNSKKYITQNKNSSFFNSEEPASDSESCRLSDQQLNYSVNICVDNSKNNFEDLPSIDMNCQKNSVECKILTPVKEKNFEIIKTPSNNEYIIKTVDVTPMQNYEAMSSPERNKELEKYGLKPFKRKRAIQLLTYIYNQTHPVVESCEDGSPTKKKKPNSPQEITRNLSQSPRKSQKSPLPKTKFSVKKLPAVSQDLGDKDNIFIQTDDTPAIKNIACEPEDWVFQKREKAKVHSCRVPLHIAFHNYVSCRRLLREAILCYEPINIDIVHRDLVAAGYRYNPKDLLKFMDKKCITVKTADNNARNKR